MPVCAGMDVGAREVVVALSDAPSAKPKGNPHRFTNDPKGVANLLPWLRRHRVERVVLEATGVYHLDLALALHADGALPVMVLNPKAAKYLDAQIRALEARTLDRLQVNDDLNHHYERLLSIKGVGDKSAIQRLGERLVLPDDLRAKQWVAMAGLDPRHHESGASVDKPARISKAGNRALRTALFMPALCAVRHAPQVKAYAEHLVQHRGLRRIQALCAVMRKLLHAIHGMWKSLAPFDPERFFQAHDQHQTIEAQIAPNQ